MRIMTDVLAVLSALEFPAERHAKITEQLERSMYTRVNKVLEAAGGKWNRREQAHVFDEDAQAVIDALINTGEVTTNRDRGFFPTPAPLARRLVEMAGILPGMRVLEPSAGTGRLVDAILEAKPDHVVAIERDLPMRHALIARARTPAGVGLWVDDVDDFMDYQPRYGGNGGIKRFDRTVMNPPFCRSGKGDHLDHVVHALDLLAPGGVLVSVLPSSITFRRDRRHTEFRARIDKHRGEVISLPDRSFAESGTSVNAVALRIAT